PPTRLHLSSHADPRHRHSLPTRRSSDLQRDRAKAALDHARAQCGMAAAVNAEKIDAFARLMNAKLDAGDTNTRKGYINSIIDAIEVDDETIRIIGSKDILQAAIAGKQTENGNVRGFVRKWRA